MILVGQYDSPYTRRVAVSLHLLGFDFEHDTRSVFADFDSMRTTNPLGRIPSLILDDGTTLINSASDPRLARPAGRTGARAAAAKRAGAPAGAAARRAGERHDRQGHGHRLRAPDPPRALSLAGLDRALPHPGRGRPRRAGEAVMAGRRTAQPALDHHRLHDALRPARRSRPAAARPLSGSRRCLRSLRGAAGVQGDLSRRLRRSVVAV